MCSIWELKLRSSHDAVSGLQLGRCEAALKMCGRLGDVQHLRKRAAALIVMTIRRAAASTALPVQSTITSIVNEVQEALTQNTALPVVPEAP